ncbi:MAG: hypothetical protein ABGX31_07840 [bacterium]
MTSNKVNDEELTEEDLVVKVYTMKSGEDFLDEDGFPCLSPEKKDKAEAFSKEWFKATDDCRSHFIERI